MMRTSIAFYFPFCTPPYRLFPILSTPLRGCAEWEIEGNAVVVQLITTPKGCGYNWHSTVGVCLEWYRIKAVDGKWHSPVSYNLKNNAPPAV
jgi:hypothetical protein